ncbi:SDR family oxidoreductase [Clostridium sp. D2Q-11]|uniref:SDR family oxidoreductase n=1 Tax=Anaeromonas frigoriresistens TaxID=2683708 RepID=A0A942UYG9_9FIRM|nr:SDR family oxidoreductase [Anaeromonas frigoriresistens]MBS4539134.1 SDR family oxidoreductase [Anaeromonas frigoriresistens]
MDTVLVTGGAGFIGSNIVDRLIKNGDKVIIIDNLSTGKKENINKKAIFYEKDIRDKSIEEVFDVERPKYVIHHAAQIDVQQSIENPVLDGDINILGTINILENCKKYDVKKIIYASSAGVYGEPEYLGIDEKHSVKPISNYGISKLTPEHYIRTYSQIYGLKYTILRYSNVYGIRQDPKGEGGVVSIFMDKMFNKENPIIFGDGSQTRDFIYVDDVVEANILALQKGDNQIFNIGTSVATSIKELFDIMNSIIGYNLKIDYSQWRKGDIIHSYFNISKAKNKLDWTPKYSLEKGINIVINYYK